MSGALTKLYRKIDFPLFSNMRISFHLCTLSKSTMIYMFRLVTSIYTFLFFQGFPAEYVYEDGGDDSDDSGGTSEE